VANCSSVHLLKRSRLRAANRLPPKTTAEQNRRSSQLSECEKGEQSAHAMQKNEED